MTKYYEATLPNGAKFTRSTQTRTYTHMVVQWNNVAEARLECVEHVRASWELNLKYHQERAAGGHKREPFYSARRTNEENAAEIMETDRRNAESQQDSLEMLAAGIEPRIKEALEHFDKVIATSPYVSADKTTTYRDMGWCGRPDLAEKLAGTGPRTMILDAVECAKPVKAKKAK